MAADELSETFKVTRVGRRWWQIWRKRNVVEYWVPLTREEAAGVSGSSFASFYHRIPLRRYWRRKRAGHDAALLDLYRIR